MNKYWKVKSETLKKALQKYNDAVRDAIGRVLDEVQIIARSEYAAGVDTKNISYIVSTFGTTYIALKFASPPENLKYWRHINSSFYVPKSVNPFYKKFKALEAAFPQWNVEQLIGMKTIRSDGSFCRAGLEKLGDDFYIVTDEQYKGSPKLQRISDLELEAARSANKKRKK